MADLGRGRAGVDTTIFIYLIEEHPRFLPLVEPTLLVVPFRASNPNLARRYEALLTNSKGIAMVARTRNQLRFAAQLRAATGVKTPDALQPAAVFAAGCSTFSTNDRRIPEQRGLRVLQLGDYAA